MKPASKFHFREYKDCDVTLKEEGVKLGPAQPLLYVHQEEWQQKLLIKYGNSITLMDATYKTTKYELPMFLVSVKTNVGYSAVADFIIQSETAEQIAEALKILTTWKAKVLHGGLFRSRNGRYQGCLPRMQSLATSVIFIGSSAGNAG